ncbi:putative cupredoxin [Rosa chinensis]|uniref:Putative cupredoxin n=1 Tax=Rosa chinensis TaxID=74649 RepID=A0A2P6RIT7_ROSCH|nr:putative cupredoxin [Rosa chinensis]
MKYVFVLVIAIAAIAEGAEYTVGDDMGWMVLPTPDYYASWVSKYYFVENDTLAFDFPVGEQHVAFVTNEDFDTCTTTNPLWESPVPDEVALVHSGTFYFIGTFAGHCAKGQKVVINWTNSPVMTPAQSPTPSSSAAVEANSNAKLPLKHLSERVDKHNNKKRVSLTMGGAIDQSY